MLKWCVPNKEQRAFCRMGLHSSGCRSMCIPQNAFDKYQNKNLHKDCQSTKTLSLTQEVSEMQIRWKLERHSEKTLPLFWLYIDIFFLKYLSQALLGQWVLSWMEQSLTAVPVLMVVVILADLSHGWSLTEAQCLIKCVWRLFCSPWTSANSNFSQWLISRG